MYVWTHLYPDVLKIISSIYSEDRKKQAHKTYILINPSKTYTAHSMHVLVHASLIAYVYGLKRKHG